METQFKVIKTEAEYRSALARFEKLLEADEEHRAYDDMELLSVLIEKYEDEHYPIDPPDPIEAIKFRMEQDGLTQKDLIPYIGSRSKVSEVLSGKRELTLAMIRALNKHLGIPAEVLIRKPQKPLPRALADLDFSKFPIKAMAKQGAFIGFNLGKSRIEEKAEEAIRWLVDCIDGFSTIPKFALRKTDGMRLNAMLDTYALIGWSLLVLREASEHNMKVRFKPEFLTEKFIKTLVSLSVLDDGPQHAVDYLAKAGITLIIQPHLPHTYLDGAVFLMDGGRPIIALTLRYDRIDNFWFVLLHELGHLALGHLADEKSWIADDLDLSSQDSPQEIEADQFASRMLLPEDFDLDRKERVTPMEVLSYARENGVHPAIVAGRIRHTRKNYRILSDLVGIGYVRKLFQKDGKSWDGLKTKETIS